MRRLMIFLLCLILLMIPVSAASSVTSIRSNVTVSFDNTCQVSLSVNLRLEDPVEELWYPLPAQARNISLNGMTVHTRLGDDCVEVDVSDMVAGHLGDTTLNFHYEMADLVAYVQEDEDKEGKLVLTLPLLAGFQYTVEYMDFTITLPPDGEVLAHPNFSSCYQQTDFESNMGTVVKDGRMVTGSVVKPMKDHETLVMTLTVPQEMFPGVVITTQDATPMLIAMGVCAGLALIYWIVALRCLPVIRRRRATPVEGVSAGEMGCRLTMTGADLTMMVMNWAQLGYILIHLDDNGRVILHKRMEMGNERSAFEVKCFKSLFGRRRVVDGTGYQYAMLCRKVAQNVPGQKEMYKRNAGNVRIFRILAVLVQILCGVCFALEITSVVVLQVLLLVVFITLGAVSGWFIQAMAYRLHLRGKLDVLIGLGCIVLWVLLGLLSGAWLPALLSVACQFLAGLAAAYGGRRSDLGRYNAMQVLGLRHYLKTIDKEDILRQLQMNPDYFFFMMPYALALGVEKPFAKQFGRRPMPRCSYLVVAGVNGKMNAEEWAKLLREAADILDYRQKRLRFERFLMR